MGLSAQFIDPRLRDAGVNHHGVDELQGVASNLSYGGLLEVYINLDFALIDHGYVEHSIYKDDDDSSDQDSEKQPVTNVFGLPVCPFLKIIQVCSSIFVHNTKHKHCLLLATS
mgnify:CR=1 FL=1